MTHKYDEATEAGIENMWSGQLKLDNKRQLVVGMQSRRKEQQTGLKCMTTTTNGRDDAREPVLVVYVV